MEAYQLLHEGTLVLSEIEHNGVRIDKDYLDATILDIDEKINDLTNKMKKDKEVYPRWRKRYGSKRSSPTRVELAKVLNKMGYDLPKTASELENEDEFGSQVNKTVLEKLRTELPFLKDFQDIERLKYTKATYFAGIQRELIRHHKDWYVHPSYNLNTVITIRSSCNAPNFQNIPVRNPVIAEMVRKCYIPPDGWYFVEVDFEQLEVKISYCYHKDPTMGKYLNENVDYHRQFASRIFMADEDQISKNARYAAKNMFTFPQFYGSVYFQCAEALWNSMDVLDGMRLMKEGDDPKNPTGRSLRNHLERKGITKLGKCDPQINTRTGTFEHHIKQLEKTLWEDEFPVYNEWKRTWYDKYLRDGGFMMKTGFAVNAFLKRNDVINYPVQGPAFHCMLKCLIKISKWLRKYKMKSKMVGEIHDSAQFVCPHNELQDVLTYCHWVMTVWLPRELKWIIAPMETETEVSPRGESWYAKKVWNRKKGVWQAA